MEAAYLEKNRREFEISTWRIALPNEFRQSDYNTISDVILHLRYTAREGGDILKREAVTNLSKRIKEAQAAGTVRLFSMRHEFPTEWGKFTSAKDVSSTKPAELKITLKPEHYPFWSHGRLGTVGSVELFARPKLNSDGASAITLSNKTNDEPSGSRMTDKLDKNQSLNDIRTGKLSNIALPDPTGTFTLYFDDNSIEDLWIAIKWGGNS